MIITWPVSLVGMGHVKTQDVAVNRKGPGKTAGASENGNSMMILCSSLNRACEIGCSYCHECSHTYIRGFGVHSGKYYRWEHNPWFGPSLLGADWWTVLKKQPIGFYNPFWELFELWLDKRDYGHMWR